MAATATSKLFDAAVRHGIDLTKYSNSTVRRIIALLNRSDDALMREIAEALERLPPESFTVKRLQDLLTSVRQLNKEAYTAVGKELTGEMKDLVDYESGYQVQLFDSLDLSVAVHRVSAASAYAAAVARPFQGRLLSEWMASLEDGRAVRVRDAIRDGYMNGRTNAEIVRRLRGTRAEGYRDGILEISRRDAEAVVRTAVGHFASFTRDRFYDENSDLIAALRWVATLDSRTSPECRVRDGLRYTTDHKPIGHRVPWGAGPGRLHWCCRSTSSPVLVGDEDERPYGSRAAQGGPVSAGTTFASWLKRQPASVQDDILGPTRGKLLRQGGLDLKTFYNDKGQYLTLEQLREKDAAAFERAGVE